MWCGEMMVCDYSFYLSELEKSPHLFRTVVVTDFSDGIQTTTSLFYKEQQLFIIIAYSDHTATVKLTIDNVAIPVDKIEEFFERYNQLKGEG